MGWLHYALVLIPLLVILHAITVRFQPTLRRVPGPYWAAWSNLWRCRDAFQGEAHVSSIELHRKYGKLVRVGPNAISVSDPEMIPVIYNTSGEFTKTGFYPLQSITWHKRQQVNVFSTRDEAVHREMKRKTATAYTAHALLKMEREIDECGDLLVEQMRKCVHAGKTFDLGAWLLYYSTPESFFACRCNADRDRSL